MNKLLKYLVIHCTATPEGMDVTAAEIRQWHTDPKPKGRGWKQVGYSDLVTLDGSLINLVPFDLNNHVDNWETTNGVAGINDLARHVVYAGGGHPKPADTRTEEQKKTLAQYVHYQILRTPALLVGGHYQFDARKACPSFDVPAWLGSIGVAERNIYRKGK